MKSKLLSLATLSLASTLWAGPAAKSPVAEGYADWEGITEKNYIFGRTITASDMRHRVVVVFHFSADALKSSFVSTRRAFEVMTFPASHSTNWDTLEAFPRDYIPVAIVHGDCDAEKFAAATRPPKGQQFDDKEKYAIINWQSGTFAAIYNEKVKLVGGTEPTKFPYIQIFHPDSDKPAWEGEFSGNKKTGDELVACIKKGKEKVAALNWVPIYGTAEIQHNAKAKKIIASGKPAPAALKLLAAAIKDKNPEKAKEAQIFFDALHQFKSDTFLRIMLEFHTNPARAYVDFQSLVKLFPAEKKNLQAADAYLKQHKDALSVGKMMAKYLEWNDPNFTFKSAGDAKKAAAEVATWKKTLDKLSQDQSNASLAGEAALLGSFLEGYGDVLMSKVPQK